ncbi:GTPase [Malassezia pachydermatis]
MPSASTTSLPPVPRATSIIVIGMAGSGKSTFVAKLASHLGQCAAQAAMAEATNETHETRPTRPYLINIDPAVATLGYAPNVDIRDTVDYTRVMEEYKLGPNGGILTSLNLFTTKFDQVLQLVEKRANEVEHVVLDTPGQIEIFTWSASGSIITDSLASAMPTVLVYVVDTPRTTAPATFMSNMLYACSILYKSRLPFILVFNKIDVQPHAFAMEWMQDFEAFQRALASGHARDPSAQALHGDEPVKDGTPSTFESRGEEPSYLNSLMNSMSLVLDEFYQNLRAVGVSSATGEGMDDFLQAVQEARHEYMTDYRPQMEAMLQQKKAEMEKSKQEQMKEMLKDMSLRDSRSGLAKVRAKQRAGADSLEPSYDGDGEIIDPDSDEEKPEYGAPGGDERLSRRWNTIDGSYWPTPQDSQE